MKLVCEIWYEMVYLHLKKGKKINFWIKYLSPIETCMRNLV